MKKKHQITIACVALFMLSIGTIHSQDLWDGTTAKSFRMGDGTSSNPYQIRTGAELLYFFKQIEEGNTYEGQYFKLMNDIDMNKCEHENKGTFAGDFDGNKHCVSNLNSGNRSNPSVVCNFIEYLSGTIHDLKYFNKINSTYGDASLVYTIQSSGLVYNCYADVYSSSITAGNGAFACVNNGTIQDCYGTGYVEGRGEYGMGYLVAALVYDNRGTIRNIASTVKVKDYGGNDKSSSLTYKNTGTIENCFQGKNEITTMFDFNGNECIVELIDMNNYVSDFCFIVDKDTEVGSLPIPESDLTFDGWFRYGDRINETDLVSSNWTLFAKYSRQIRKQPSIEDMSIEYDDSENAYTAWYKIGNYHKNYEGWTSTNHENNSSSSQSYTFSNVNGKKLTFDYKVSSEREYDYLKVYLNGTLLFTASGEYSRSRSYTYEFTTDEDYILKFVYTKDDSDNEGDDNAIISNIIISESPTLIASNVDKLSSDLIDHGAVYYCVISYSNCEDILTSDFVKISDMGDVNGDNLIDISDVVMIVNHILGTSAYNFNVKAADLNLDGIVDISDVVEIVNLILK